MNKQLHIEKDLKSEYFWDVDISKLNAHISKRLIIERVFAMGTMKEIRLIIKFYGEKEVIDVLTRLNYIDPKTLNFISKFFNISYKAFKCYTRKQLNPQRWTS